jgi:hypothetical protein
MQSSTSKVNIPVRYENDHIVIECNCTEMLADVAERFPELIANQAPGTCVLLDMSQINSIKGDGLETLMQVHELGQDHSCVVGMFQVTFYVQQLLSVLDLQGQLPPVVEGQEQEAASKLRELSSADSASPVTEAEFEFEMPADESDAFTSPQNASTARLNREEALSPLANEDLPLNRDNDPSENLLAVDFSDFKAPVLEEEDDTFEISLDSDMAFADTDKFSKSDIDSATKDLAKNNLSFGNAVGIQTQRPTEFFPAFSDLEKGSLLFEMASSGMESLLAVDFDDFKSSRAVSSTETPPDGVPVVKDTPTDIVDVGDFELDYESQDDMAAAPANATLFSASPSSDSGYSPLGQLDQKGSNENPYASQAYAEQEADARLYDPKQLTGNPLARMETQEMHVPTWALLETVKLDQAQGADAPAELDSIDESSAPPPTIDPEKTTELFSSDQPPLPRSSSTAATTRYEVQSLYDSAEDNQEAVMFQLTPEAQAQIQQSLAPSTPAQAPATAPETDADFYGGDGEDSMILTDVNAMAEIQAMLAKEAAKLGLTPATPPNPTPPTGDVSLLETQPLPQVTKEVSLLSESQRLQSERAALEEERRLFAEEKARLQLAADRRAFENERRKFEEEKRQLALETEQRHEERSESQRMKLQQELSSAREANRLLVVEAADAERRRLEAELKSLREDENRKVESEVAREAERKRLEEQFRQSADNERKRLEAEIHAARAAARRKKSGGVPVVKAPASESGAKQWGPPNKKVKVDGASDKPRSTDEINSIEEQTALKATDRTQEKELDARNTVLRSFIAEYAINSALHVKILGFLKRAGGRPEGKAEVAKFVNANQAAVGQILDDFVQARVVKRVRAPRIRGGYGYSFSASPKTRNMIVTLLRLSNEGASWPIV